MELVRHCELCDHQKKSLKEETTCGLTNRKPEFNKTCIKIELNEKFENILKSFNISYEKFKRAKFLTYAYFVVFFIIGISVIIGGYLLGKYAFDNRVFSAAPLIIMGVGLGPLGMAFGTLNKHRLDLNAAKVKKDRVDQVLKLYRIEYEIDIKFGKEYHGNQDVYVDLKTKGIK